MIPYTTVVHSRDDGGLGFLGLKCGSLAMRKSYQCTYSGVYAVVIQLDQQIFVNQFHFTASCIVDELFEEVGNCLIIVLCQ